MEQNQTPTVKITVRKNGPARVEGLVEWVDQDGNKLEMPNPVSLCRCTKSSKMPICDGAHKTCDAFE